MHTKYGHLGFPGLLGVIKPRAWWHTLDQDLRNYSLYCLQCQTVQGQLRGLEREAPQHMVNPSLQPFKRWGIDFIGLLPTTPNGNRWIITAIDYATGWLVAKAVKDAEAETVADFLVQEIFMHYGPPKELLSDNGTNLLANVVEHYLRKLHTRHRYTTAYHPRTNGKVENLNGTLGDMLTKYLAGKPTKLWDKYLPQALFATRIRAHSTSKYSPYYLLYGQHPHLPSDDNPLRPLEVVATTTAEHEKRIADLRNARSIANETLLERLIKAKKIREERVEKGGRESIPTGQWVLVRHEDKHKFESR